MKPWLLILTMSAATATAQAAPARKITRPKWEYAVLELGAGRGSGSDYEYGALLSLPNKKIFLVTRHSDSPEYKTYILNRLGIQGWELLSAPGNRGNQTYIFKRSK